MHCDPPFVCLPVGLVRDQRLSAHELRLYLLLLAYADGDGRCYPRQGRLAQELGIHRTRVCHLLQGLKALGLVRVQAEGERLVYVLQAPPTTGQPAANHAETDVRDTHTDVRHDQTPVRQTHTDVRDTHTTRAPDAHPTCDGRTPYVRQTHTELKPVELKPGELKTRPSELLQTSCNAVVDGQRATRASRPTADQSRASKPSRARTTATAPPAPPPTPPAELSVFHAILAEFPEYRPTAAFYAKVLQYQDLDLESVALSIADWCRRRRKPASVARVLNWLAREREPLSRRRSDGTARPGPDRADPEPAPPGSDAWWEEEKRRIREYVERVRFRPTPAAAVPAVP